ncbi:hypothetical protein D5272_01170 [bacterium D16-76]|nr:hypothetical protein [bacterium D16-76]
MENLKKICLSALIPGAIMAVIATITDSLPSTWWLRIGIVFCMYAACILAIYLFSLNGWIKSQLDLWQIGKIRGLWQHKGLVKQLEKNMYSSNKIRIKVTRGIELLNPKKEYSFFTELNSLKHGKDKTHSQDVEMQILLVIPCYKDPHVIERKDAHQDIPHEKFLKTWYDFLDKIDTYRSEYLHIDVKFYLGSHARWRFYIFEKANPKKNTCVLLSEYDSKSGGIDNPMYRIMRGEKNIAGFMCNYFDTLWNSKSTFSPKDWNSYIETQKCQSHFCQNCDDRGMSNCKNCGRKSCEYEDICKKLSQEHMTILQKF